MFNPKFNQVMEKGKTAILNAMWLFDDFQTMFEEFVSKNEWEDEATSETGITRLEVQKWYFLTCKFNDELTNLYNLKYDEDA